MFTPFPILNQFVVPCLVLTIASWSEYRVSQETGKVVWYSHFFKNFPQLVVIHTVKGFIVGNEADVFLEFSCFLYEPANVDSLISGSSAFLNSAWTSGSSWFTYCWSHVKWAQLFGSFSILWHCFSLGLEWKLTFSSPVATAEFSNFAGIWCAALSQHHLLGFEIA